MQKNGFTITPESGNGNGTINVSAEKWYGDSNRTTNINVKTYDGKVTKTVNIVQKANQKITETVIIDIIYKGRSGINYIFDVSWKATSNICTEAGSYFTPILTKDGEDIELYKFENPNDTNASQTDVEIPISSFGGMDPASFTSDDITADWDLGEQAFDTRINLSSNTYKILINVDATVSYSNNEYIFTLSNLSRTLDGRVGSTTLAQTKIEYKCGGIVKNYFNVNNSDLNSAAIGTYQLSTKFKDTDFTTNNFELLLTDVSLNKYIFEVNIIRAKVNVRLNYDSSQRVLNIQAETQSILKGNINITNIVTSEGDRYDGSMIIYAGMQYSDAITLTRTDSEETATVDYSVNGGDVLRIPVAATF